MAARTRSLLCAATDSGPSCKHYSIALRPIHAPNSSQETTAWSRPVRTPLPRQPSQTLCLFARMGAPASRLRSLTRLLGDGGQRSARGDNARYTARAPAGRIKSIARSCSSSSKVRLPSQVHLQRQFLVAITLDGKPPGRFTAGLLVDPAKIEAKIEQVTCHRYRGTGNGVISFPL